MILRFKGLVVFALAVLMLAQSGIKTAVVLYYYANKAWIAQNLCEQRDRPGSCCAGSCQVKKWLQVAESSPDDEQAPNSNSSAHQTQELVLFYEEIPVLSLSNMALFSRVALPEWSCICAAAPVPDIFHPPS